MHKLFVVNKATFVLNILLYNKSLSLLLKLFNISNVDFKTFSYILTPTFEVC